jgi:hypothetical protein
VEITLKDEFYAIIKATGSRLGLLVTIGAHGILEHERIVR